MKDEIDFPSGESLRQVSCSIDSVQFDAAPKEVESANTKGFEDLIMVI